METLAYLLLFAVIVVAIIGAVAARDHWVSRVPRASVVRRHVARGLEGPPLWLTLGTAAVIAWGVITMLVFAPLGVLYTIIGLESGETALAISGLLIAGVAVNGFAIGAAMVGCGRAMMSRDRAALRRLASRIVAHHGVVALAMIPAGLGAFVLALLPCGIGGLIALVVISGTRPRSAALLTPSARAASA